MISLKNETAGPVTIRFGGSGRGEYVPTEIYRVKPRRSARIPAGFTMNTHILVDDGRCLRTYPVMPDAAIDGGMGGRTDMAVSSDWRLYLRDPSAQPAGLPLSALTKVCR